MAKRSENYTVHLWLDILSIKDKPKDLTLAQTQLLRSHELSLKELSLETIANHLGIPIKRLLQHRAITLDNRVNYTNPFPVEEPLLKSEDGRIRHGKVARALLVKISRSKK